MEAVAERSYCPHCSAVFRTPFSRCPLDGTALATLSEDPLVGTTIDQRYYIEECIGEGGMGRVYRARHTRMSRSYALKVLFGDHAGDARMRSRFAREAEGVCRLDHRNVISVIDHNETPEGLLYLVMELAEGISLRDVLAREAPIAQGRAVHILKQLCLGLAHAHDRGLIHRDFKAENVIIVEQDGDTVPKIVDFGICMIVEDSPMTSMLTSNGMIMGTPAMMSPEQASGDKVDHRSDLFSLGIVAYQMLAGCLPFEGTPLDMARKNLYESIPPIAERAGIDIDPKLEAIIRKLVEKRPQNRYQSAHDACEDLDLLEIRSEAAPRIRTAPPLSALESAKTEIHMPTPAPPSGAHDHSLVSQLSARQPILTPAAVSPAVPSQSVGLGTLEIRPHKSKAMLVVAGVAFAAIGVIVGLWASQASDSTAPNVPVARSAGQEQRPADQTITGSTAPDRTTPAETATGTPVQPADNEVASPPLDKSTSPSTSPVADAPEKPEPSPVDRRKALAQRKAEAQRKARLKAEEEARKAEEARRLEAQRQAKSEQVTSEDVKKLYAELSSAIKQVQNTRSPAEVARIQQDFKDIDIMPVLRNPGNTAIVTGTYDKLRRLKRRIAVLRRGN